MMYIRAFTVLSIFLVAQNVCAFEFKVGGSTGWSVPSDPNVNNHNQWAEKSRFQIGDTLLFVYPDDKDSVLSVTQDDYNNCNTDSPLHKFSDGHTSFKFTHSGPYYFISGVKDNCLKNEKITVVVMADRSHQNSNSTMAPPPSDQAVNSPPPAPPAEAPTGEEAPSPPGSTPAPSEHNPPKNTGSSIVASFFTGALLIGSCIVSVF